MIRSVPPQNGVPRHRSTVHHGVQKVLPAELVLLKIATAQFVQVVDTRVVTPLNGAFDAVAVAAWRCVAYFAFAVGLEELPCFFRSRGSSESSLGPMLHRWDASTDRTARSYRGPGGAQLVANGWKPARKAGEIQWNVD